MAYQRCLQFQGAYNFRDMGGYPTREGKQVKWGSLYRSAHLAELTDPDLARFERLDVGLICDFRRKDERDLAPDRLPGRGGVNVAEIPIHTGSQQSFVEKIVTGKTSRQDMMGVMKDIYTNYVEAHAEAFSRMFHYMIDLPRGGVLIHCTAGKDRTGFGAALILQVLGVDRDTIMSDYLLSRQCFPAETALERAEKTYGGLGDMPFDPRDMMPVYEVHPDYLNQAFFEIEKRFGSMDAYLEGEIGITPEMGEVMRKRYLRQEN